MRWVKLLGRTDTLGCPVQFRHNAIGQARVPVLLPARISCCAGGVYAGLWNYGYFFLPPVGTGSGAGTTQSSGGNAMRQKSGALDVKSTPTWALPPDAGPRYTTLHCCSSCVARFFTRSVCPFTTLAASATMAPCAFTTRVWVSSWNAASLFPPSQETVTGTLTITRWLRRRLDSVPPLVGSQVDMHTTLEQRAGNDNTMHAWNTQSVNCPEDPGGSLHNLERSGDPAGQRRLNHLRKKPERRHSER